VFSPIENIKQERDMAKKSPVKKAGELVEKRFH
jgi:hypothetical protein